MEQNNLRNTMGKAQMSNLLAKISEPLNKNQAEKQSSVISLLGKRQGKHKLQNDSDEDDLMKRAKKNITQRNMQENIIQKQKREILKQEQSESETRKLQHIDPAAQKLFQMLPPPKNSQSISISGALKSNAEINLIPLNQDDSDYEPDEDSQFQKPGHISKNYIDIKSTDLINREEFELSQLKKHSLQAFRDQTLSRLKRFGNSDSISSASKGKNHLASMADDHMDLITQIQDAKTSNLDEFRSKKARYGW